MLLTECSKLQRTLICSNDNMFQLEETLLMVPLEVSMLPEYILRVAGFKDLHSYGRMRTVGPVLSVLKWTYLQMTLN